MRSRWLAELLPAAAGAVVEGVWTGALAALVTGGGAGYLPGAAAAVFCAAVLAVRSGTGREPGRRARAAAVALTVGVAAAFFAAGRGWSGQPAVAALGALVFAALLVVLGASLGRERISAGPAFRRAVRAFALLCALLALAAASGASPDWGGEAVVAALVAGVLSVTVARAGSLSRATADGSGDAAWRWPLAIAGILGLVVALGALLALVVRVDVLLWLLAVAGDLLQYALALLAFVLGWAGAGLVRVLSWLLGLFNLHPLPPVQPPQSGDLHVHALPKAPRSGSYELVRVVLTAAAAAVAVAVPLLVVALALRRRRGAAPAEVVEERETLLTLRSATAGAGARVRRRLSRLLPRRSPPATPAVQVRRDYEELERRLARAGHPRPASTTVRAYLRGLPAAPDAEQPRAAPPHAEMAGLYERARYSRAGVDAAAALRFRELARAFPVPGRS